MSQNDALVGNKLKENTRHFHPNVTSLFRCFARDIELTLMKIDKKYGTFRRRFSRYTLELVGAKSDCHLVIQEDL